MTRLAVVADVHADDFPSKVDTATGLNARWVDTIAMLRWVANDARERGCDALIVAGDLSEKWHPAPWRVAMIGEALAAFTGPVKLLRGNHDGERDGRSIVDVLAAGRPGWNGYTKPGITVVDDTAIAMLPYLDQHRLRALPAYADVAPAEAFRVLADAYLDIARGLYVKAQEVAPLQVLVVHQGLAGGNMSDTQRAFLGDQSLVVDTRALGAIGFDAILAGHFHLHQVLSTDPLIAYAGSPYRTDFGEEHQTKGYLVVDVDGAGASLAFIETPARRFVTLRGAAEYEEVAEDTVDGAVVRVLDVDDSIDTAHLREVLENLGAFDVQEIRRRPVAAPAIAGGLSEGLTPTEALAEYFAGEDDREALVERGREMLQAVA
jgi:DNA repair exonuclease SbcCD nuclease subunit